MGVRSVSDVYPEQLQEDEDSKSQEERDQKRNHSFSHSQWEGVEINRCDSFGDQCSVYMENYFHEKQCVLILQWYG